MNKLGSLFFWLGLCYLSFFTLQAAGQCASGQCGGGGVVGASSGASEPVADSPSTVAGSGMRRPIYTAPPQYAQCAPGECYLFEELVNCAVTDFSCRGGTRRIWSYRPQFYRVDNSELLLNLDKKLCPNAKNCMWPYSRQDAY
jgi:hypothetical protein